MEESRIKISVVDDNEMMCTEIINFLSDTNDFDICPPAHDYEQGLKIIESCKPDVVLIDLNLKSGHSGSDLIREIRKRNLSCRCIAISAHTRDHLSLHCRQQAISHYVSKFDIIDQLVPMIRSILNNQPNVS